jgi:hypothetical protein
MELLEDLLGRGRFLDELLFVPGVGGIFQGGTEMGEA